MTRCWQPASSLAHDGNANMSSQDGRVCTCTNGDRTPVQSGPNHSHGAYVSRQEVLNFPVHSSREQSGVIRAVQHEKDVKETHSKVLRPAIPRSRLRVITT